MKNISKTTTAAAVLIASLIVAMTVVVIAPISTASYAQEKPGPKDEVSSYAPLGTTSDFMATGNLTQANLIKMPLPDAVLGNYDRDELLKAANQLLDLQNKTDNKQLKKYLALTIDSMKPELAKKGIVLATDYDNDSAGALASMRQYQEASTPAEKDPF